jgi:hypothetical protein
MREFPPFARVDGCLSIHNVAEELALFLTLRILCRDHEVLEG